MPFNSTTPSAVEAKKSDSRRFIEALAREDAKALRAVPKADLHNHCALGGSRAFLHARTGVDIPPMPSGARSMAEMDAWSSSTIGARFDSSEGRRLLVEATFRQAHEDGVTVLDIGEDVWALHEYFHDDVGELVGVFAEARERHAPHTRLRLQIGMSRHCPIDYLEECLKPFWRHAQSFGSIDLYGDELAQPIEAFVPIYRRARERGLVLKAHVGEWGGADDVREAVELLDLDEVQHGIAAAHDPAVMEFLRERGVTLNVTPTSNLMLGRVESLRIHPIATLVRAGVQVTIGSDDVLAFDSGVSGEYLKLYQAGCLNADELDRIRRYGLLVGASGSR